METFADQLKGWRAKVKMSQDKLAARTLLSKSAIQKLEKNEYQPTVETMMRIINVINANPINAGANPNHSQRVEFKFEYHGRPYVFMRDYR